MMMKSKVSVAIVLVSGAMLALSGCSAPTAPPSPSPTSTPAISSEVIDESACTEYSAAFTLIYNMDLAQRQGRLIENEWSGIQRLTAEMIDRIEIDPATDVGVAIGAFQEHIAESTNPIEPYGDEWAEFATPVNTACMASNPNFGYGGWVGG